MCAPYVEARQEGGARAEKEIGEKAQKIIPFSSPFQKTKKKKIILFFPELFSGRDDGHRERQHEEERVFTRRARVEEFPQSGRGFSVRTLSLRVARSINFFSLIRFILWVTTESACGFVMVASTRRDWAQFQNVVVGDARMPKRRGFWTWHSRRGREKKIIANRVEMREDESALRVDD